MENTEIQIPEAFKFLFTPSRFKVIEGGRASAKSHSVASALVLKSAKKPLRWLCGREIQKSLNASVKQLIEDKIKDCGLKRFFSITRDRITAKNGTMFLFAGLRTNPDSIKSMEGLDGAWIEEADRCSQRSIDLLFPTIRKPGSEIWLTLNRRYETDPVDKLFLNKNPPPNSIIKSVSWRDNPFFPEVLRDEMEWLKKRDVDKWLHIWEGKPLRRSDARVFNNWKISDIDDQLTEKSIPRLGADWGFSVDPTVLIECYVIDRTLYIRREVYKIKCEIDEIPSLFAGSSKKWKNKFNHKGLKSVRNGFRIVADSARPETISYMKRRGFNIFRAKKGPNSVRDGIEFLRSYDIVVHPSCKHVSNELYTYSNKIDKLSGDVLPVLEDSYNHTIDALRYALESVRKPSDNIVHSLATLIKL